MKIRNGFVSNSSSSSFVIAITRDYVFSPEMKQKIYEQYVDVDGEEMPMEKFENVLTETVETLCRGNGEIYEDKFSPAMQGIVWMDKEILIKIIDVPSECGLIYNLGADEIIEEKKKQLQKTLG